MKIHWRKNVLLLVLSGYAVILVIFMAMMWPGNITAKDAYDVLEGPLMALIGGSLALAKDLIDDPSENSGDQKGDDEEVNGKDKDPGE